jgi:hypothetical protein
MTPSFEQYWMQRARFLTQALIISGTLNIGLIATFIYFTLKEKQSVVSFEAKIPKDPHNHQFTNEQILRTYSQASFQDLLLRLENKDLVEEGYLKRDLALACLVAFHHFNLEKALGGALLQKRLIAFRNPQGDEMIELMAFPGLIDDHFQAVLSYAKTEKWPYTTKGLFFEIKRNRLPYDASLLETFYLTSEFHTLYALLNKNNLNIEKTQLLALLMEGSWEKFKGFTDRVRLTQSYTIETCRDFLVTYLFDFHSKIAADCLFKQEIEYVVKRFDDQQLLTFLDLNAEKKQELEKLAKELLLSPRSDLVRQRAASILYSLSHEMMPQPYDYLTVLKRFCPEMVPQPVLKAQEALAQSKDAVKVIATTVASKENPSVVVEKTKGKRIHKVQDGESLWKISRKYNVSIEAIMKVNHLDSDRLRPGKELQIPDSKN